jgi:hypothetical protein
MGRLVCESDPAAAAARPAEPLRISRFGLDDARLAPFRTDLAAWLAKRGAEAVLVRPDHCVFGTGRADELAEAYTAVLGLAPEMAN